MRRGELRHRSIRCLLRLRYDPHIWLWRLPALRITPLRLLVGYRTRNDHVLARLPVDWRSHLMLGSQLQRVDYPQHFVEVTARRHRIDKNQLDLLVRADDVNIAHGCIIGWVSRPGNALGVRPAASPPPGKTVK